MSDDDSRGGSERKVPRAPKAGGPKRDLGPPAVGTPHLSPRLRPLVEWRTTDAFTVEAIELAAVRGEEAVQSFLRSRSEPFLHGFSTVELRFRDAATLTSFRRTRSIVAIRDEPAWRMVRRWADAGGDGGLDEAICGAVAASIDEDFAGLLTARVVTWITRP